MRTVIINAVGFDGGGIAKLGIEYSKLGFDVYFKNVVQPLQIKPTQFANVKFYDTFNDLQIKLIDYDRIIFLTFYDNILDEVIPDIVKLKLNFPNVEFCYLYCDRNLDRLLRLQKCLKNYGLVFDCYFSINPNISDIVDNYVYLNVNAFTFSDRKVLSVYDRQRIVLTAGRVEGFKGVLSYFHAVDTKFLKSDYFYIHEGARFAFNKSGTISTPPQLLTLFDTAQIPKQLKPEFVFKKYGESPDAHKLTIYPSYNLDSINRWSNYYAGICCILGSKNRCRKINNLVDSRWVIDDVRENNAIMRKSKIWNFAVEYANLEMIDVGLPVLFSRKYSEILDFHEESLIYDSFSNIPDKLDSLCVNYEDIRKRQYDIFSGRQTIVNENIKKVFTDESIIFSR